MYNSQVRLFLIFFLASCSPTKIIERVDLQSYSFWGWTFFSSQEEVYVKEILLRANDLEEQNVIVSGNIIEIGSQSAYFILKDDYAKLLVIASNLDKLDFKENTQVKVLGSIELFKGKYPALRARAVKRIVS